VIEHCGKTVGDNGNDTLLIPDHLSWIVTMWHFGMESITEYAGGKICASWEVGQHALIRAYTKDMKEQGTRIRLERQEYPAKTLLEAIEEKLYAGEGACRHEGSKGEVE